MKKISVAIVVCLILFFTVFSNGSAALPGTGWWSALMIQNISSESGALSMEAYDKDSTAQFSSDTFIYDASKSLVYDPGKAVTFPSGNYIGFQNSLPNGFEGSVVLSSGVEAASIAQIANFQNGSVGTTSGKASAYYQGVGNTIVATKLLAPTIKHNYSGTTTTMYIQSAGASADVTVTYTMADGSIHTQNQIIDAFKTFVFDPANATPPVANELCGVDTRISPCYGSAVITSTSEIAGVLIEHPHSGTPITFIQAVRLSTPFDESTKIYIPSVKNNFATGSGTGIAGAAVMNVGDDTALVRITLTVTAVARNAPSWVAKGDIFTNTVEIPKNENYLFSKWLDNLGGMPAGTMAAAVIESVSDGTHSPQNLVGSSNDAKTQSGFPGQAKVKYSAFSDTLATDIAYAPMVKEFFSQFTGGATVQNVGIIPDIIYIEYHEFGTDNVYIFKTKSEVPVGGAAQTNWISVTGDEQFIPVNSGWTFADLAGKQFSIVTYSENNQNLIIMVTENTPSGVLDIARYEGINK